MVHGRRLNLCGRRGCCPEVILAAEAGARWAATIVEPGGGERPAGEVRFTRDELLALAHLLDEEGLVEEARRCER